MMRFPKTAMVATLLLVTATAGHTDPLPGSVRAAEALDLCVAAEHAQASEKTDLLERGLALAEEAVAADDTDARAHFAVFCNLGRQLQLQPVGLGSLRAIGRLRKSIDRTLELAPDSVDALAAKGAFLCELPRFLGGDRSAGERFLRRALEIDPVSAFARDTLARLGASRG
jgi:hypothetical protein